MRGILVSGITALLVMQAGGDAAAQTVAGAERSEANAAEEPALQRPARLQVKGVSLNDALAQLSEHSGVVVAYSPTRLAAEAHVDCDCAELTVEEALQRLLAFTRYRYTEVDGHVVVVPRPVSKHTPQRNVFSSSQPFLASFSGTVPMARTSRRLIQQDTVSGIVVAAGTGEGLAGAQVTVVGTDRGTLTDAEGRFRIDRLTGTQVRLRIQRIGYRTASQVVSVGAADVRFALEESAIALGEVVVTAQKREERLLDVPASIAIVTPEAIDRRGLVSDEDYLRGMPGVNQRTDLVGTNIVIRGLETSSCCQNLLSGVTVATYFDETPTTNSGGLFGGANVDVKLADIERVEVLRGPHGTAFGSSSLGGVVRTIPAAPRLDGFEGTVRTRYSATSGTGGDNYSLQAVGNLPLIQDKLALRATGYRFHDSGFYRNVVGSAPDIQQQIAEFGAQAFAVDREQAGSATFAGGRIAALFRPRDDLEFALSYLRQTTTIDGVATANRPAAAPGELAPRQGIGSYEQALLQVAPEHRLHGHTGGLHYTSIDLANAKMEYDLGWANLLATLSYIESGTDYAAPSLLPDQVAWPRSGVSLSGHRARVGEIRLATRFDGAWNLLGGLYAEDLDDKLTSHSVWYGDSETNFIRPGERFLGGRRLLNDLKHRAIFAEVSWEFLQGATLTGGMRAYDYERTSRNDPIDYSYATTSTGPLLATDATGTTFRANISYKPQDNALLYATWSEGFRLGRPQPGLDPVRCDLDGDGIVDGSSNPVLRIEDTRSVESDNVQNYELGGKISLLNRRLMLAGAVYRINWVGVPFLAIAPINPQTGERCGSYTANAGGAFSEGLELEAQFYVTEALRADLGGFVGRGELTEDAPASGAFKGARLAGSPELSANLGLQYEFDIGGAQAFVRTDAIYVGPYNASVQELVFTRVGDYVKADASARVGLGLFDVGVFVRNITNENHLTFRYGTYETYGSHLRPRTIGLELGRTF